MEDKTKDIKISSDPLSDSEIDNLIDGINKSPGFNNFTNKEISKYIDDNALWNLRHNTKLIGITAIKPINKRWTEFAVFFIFKKYRDKGFGKILWSKTINSVSGQNIFLVTSNPRVKRLAKEYDFQKKYFFKLPLKVMWHFVANRFKKRKIGGVLKKITKKQVKFSDFSFYIHKKNK